MGIFNWLNKLRKPKEKMLPKGRNLGKKSEEKFSGRMKVSSLKPENCKGDNLIRNIFIELGIDEGLLENPMVFRKLTDIFSNILNQNCLGNLIIEKRSEESIRKMFDAVKNAVVLSRDQIHEKGKNYIGIKVGRGVLRVQSIIYDRIEGQMTCLDENLYMDSDANVICEYRENECQIGITGKRERTIENGKSKYGKNGVETSREAIQYDYISGQRIIKEHIKLERDSRYPFIQRKVVLYSNGVKKENPQTSLQLIDLEQPDKLGTTMQYIDSSGKKRDEFESEKEIRDFYDEQHDWVDVALQSWGCEIPDNEAALVVDIFSRLGVDKDIINNPRNIEYYKSVFKSIMQQNGFENYNIIPNENDLEKMLSFMRASNILSAEEIKEKYMQANNNTSANPCFENGLRGRYGIEIDSQTDSVRVQSLVLDNNGILKIYHQNNSLDSDGNLLYETKALEAIGVGDNRIRIRLNSGLKGKESPEGIGLEKEVIHYENGEFLKHEKYIRNKKFPFSAQRQIFSENGSCMTSDYIIIDENNIGVVNYPKTVMNEQGVPTTVCFRNEDGIKSYFWKNRGSLLTVLSKNLGMKKLAIKAGIIKEVEER